MKKFSKVKVLSVSNNKIIGAKGYGLVYLNNNKWLPYASVDDKKSLLLSKIRLIQRFTRSEITRHYILNSGTELCVARKGIFRKGCNEKKFTKCFTVPRGSRPLNLCEFEDKIYFGEYFQNVNKEPVHIYCSGDDGKTWYVEYTFNAGEVHHIHGIFNDSFTRSLWVVTGDGNNECVIANTSDNFKSLNIIFRGSQEYRTCNLFFYKDFICFATDTELEQNYIKVFDRKTLGITILKEIQGTAIKGGQVGNISFLSTTVEPSNINKDTYSHLWISSDGKDWREIYSAKKDFLPHLFQFGSIEFPEFYVNEPLKHLWFSGRALSKIDGKSIVIDL